MKSSLPQIFNKDLYQITLPQKQSPQYSLFLRTNNFTLKNSNQQSSRYNNGSSQRVNKSMDMLLSQRKASTLSKQLQNTNGLKNLLTQRRKTQSRSLFIEQRQSQTAQQIESFKTIRKRVVQQLALIEKSLTMIKKSQNSIKQGMESFKTNQIKDWQQFQEAMLKQINYLRLSFKSLRKQTNVQTKVNKQLAVFLQQQVNNIESILHGFQLQSNKLKHQIISDINLSKK